MRVKRRTARLAAGGRRQPGPRRGARAAGGSAGLAADARAVRRRPRRPRQPRRAPTAAPSGAVPLPRRQILEARTRLLDLAACLRADRPVYARGMALLSWLLTDGSGPVYLGQADEALPDALRAVAEGARRRFAPWAFGLTPPAEAARGRRRAGHSQWWETDTSATRCMPAGRPRNRTQPLQGEIVAGRERASVVGASVMRAGTHGRQPAARAA